MATINVTCNTANSGYVFAQANSWPPTAGTIAASNGTETYISGYYVATTYPYRTYETFLEFDTSVLGATAAVSACNLYIYVVSNQRDDGSSWNLDGEYYDYGSSITTADHFNPNSNSGTVFVDQDFMVPTGAWAYPTVSNVSSINVTGTTRMRFSINNGTSAPTGINTIAIRLNQASYKPYLYITYTTTYGHAVMGLAGANMSSFMGLAGANTSTIMGV